MRYAITREVSPSLADCELTHVEREPIDIGRARAQHAGLRGLLVELGCTVIHLPAAPALPDSVFVEDTAVVFDDLAVIARPGVASRRPETSLITDVLRCFRRTAAIEAPGRLEGGDVLCLDKRVFVGLSSRTNESGVAQLRDILAPLGHEVRAVRVAGCLHLKSGVTAVADETLLMNPAWMEPSSFPDCRTIAVNPAEPRAGNALRIGDTVLTATEHPRTRTRLLDHGIACRSVDANELAKAEGGLTCCSIVFDAPRTCCPKVSDTFVQRRACVT